MPPDKVWSGRIFSVTLSPSPRSTVALMTFDAELADRVEDLATRERSCCGFLSITTLRSDDDVRLEMKADNPAARPVIEAMAGLGGQ